MSGCFRHDPPTARSAEDAADLAARLGAEWVHARTGARPHSSYYPAKLLWLRRARLQEYTRVARWMSFGEYLTLRLFGRALASVSMASGTGLLNAGACVWDEELLRRLDLDPGRLSPLAREHEALSGLRACSNVGSGCVTPDRAALMIGTSGSRFRWAVFTSLIRPTAGPTTAPAGARRPSTGCWFPIASLPPESDS